MKHGMAPKHGPRKNIYRRWQHMIQRCHNVNDRDFPRYGARGVAVCDRWRFGDGETSGFTNFINDMGEPPNNAHSIDRLDVNGPYSPGNCRWATAKQQARNRTRNTYVEAFGLLKTQAEWCEKYGLSHQCFRHRLRSGMTAEEALTRPVKSRISKEYSNDDYNCES